MAAVVGEGYLRHGRGPGLVGLLALVVLAGCQSQPLVRGQSPLSSLLGEPGSESNDEAPPVPSGVPRLLDGFAREPEPVSTGATLVEIRIEGNEAIPAREILRQIRVQPGRPFTRAEVRDDMRRLFATRWFFLVDTEYRREPAGTVLVFKVVERPMIRSISYAGNKRLSDKDLAEKTGLRPGSPFDIYSNREAARKLQEFYRDKRFAFATVTLSQGHKRGDRDVVFQIEEGQKVQVSGVTFQGNNYTYATAPILRTKIRTKAAFLGIGLLGGKFEREKIPHDEQALLDYYRGLGFFDVKVSHRVLKQDVLFNPIRKGDLDLTIEYTIDEGTRYKVRRVTLSGNKVLSEKDLQADFTLSAGDYFNKRYLARDVRRMKDKYGRLGRLFAKVEPMTRFDEQVPGVVDVVYRIDEHRPYLVGPIDVHFHGDHPHTKETVVLNRLLIQPGELADPALLRRSEIRLGGMIFERGPVHGPKIRIRPMEPHELVPKRISADPLAGLIPEVDPGREVAIVRAQNEEPPAGGAGSGAGAGAGAAGPPRRLLPYNPILENSPLGDPLGSLGRALIDPDYGLIELDIDVTEARTGRLMFGAGVNSDAGVVGSIVLDENNFDLFRLPTSLQSIADGTAWRGGGQRLRIEALPGNIISRYMLNWSDPFFLDTDYSLSIAGFYYQRFYFDWDEQRTGGRVTLGRQLTREWTLSGTLRLESVELSNPDVPTPALLAAAVGESWFTSGRVALTHDTRDSSFLPGEGHFLQASYEQAFGDFSFPMVRGDARQYYTLHERPDGQGRHILSLSGQVGWAGDDTPIYERFFAGGYQSFRGFDYRGVSSRQVGFPNTGIGGRFMLLGSLQYQMPLTASEMISAVVFTDMGTIEDEVSVDEFRLTVGAGVRLTIPAMGPVPIALDFGFPIMKQPFDDQRMFSFYIGINR